MNAPSVSVTVNGKPHEVASESTISALLDALEVRRERCAVEVNRAVVPRSQHGAHTLRDGDVVEIVSFVGGG